MKVPVEPERGQILVTERVSQILSYPMGSIRQTAEGSPGVMAATAADVLLKSDGIIPSGGIVLAGSGPLLLLTADRLLWAGASVKAILDTTPRSNFFRAIPCLPKARSAQEYLIIGNGQVRELQVDTLLHNGVVPDTQLTGLLECEHQWDAIQRYWQPVTDVWGNTSVAGIGVFGDATGIAGARSAEAAGHLAALEAACALDRISVRERNRNADIFQKRLARERAVRPFLERLFSPRRYGALPVTHVRVNCIGDDR
jgi:hypothetical protein